MSDKRIFSGSSIPECLDKASKDFNVDENCLKYEVLEEKKSFFKKTYSVQVWIENIKTENPDGVIWIKDGSINVKNPKDNGRKATISSSNRIKIFVDGEEVNKRISVTEDNEILWESIDELSSREIDFEINDDKTEVVAKVEFNPSKEFVIKDCNEITDLIPGDEVIKAVSPPPFTSEEVILALKKLKIAKGVKPEAVNKISTVNEDFEIVVAEGIKAVKGTDDKLIVNFDDKKIPCKDERGNVDFKSIGHVDNIKTGDILCSLELGKLEENGIDVFGKEIKTQKCKRINVIAGKGCRLEENKIVAEVSGKAIKKGYTFSVEPVYVINGDVDVATGDIKFEGNIEIVGEVTEGMKVESGSSIEIHKGSSGAEIVGMKNITISGNVITSKVASGGEDVLRRKLHLNITEIYNIISELHMMAGQVFQGKLLGEEVSLGEVYKILIERRFKKLISAIEEYEKTLKIKYDSENELVKKVKSKFYGLAPVTIRDTSEVDEVLRCIKAHIDASNLEDVNESDIVLSYIQDSRIVCNGDVFINGKGEYVSEIISNGSIYFGENSVARGGYLKAKELIKCNIVGSSGRVRTTLHVESKGSIIIEEAFSNTKIVIGKVERILEEDVRKLKAYLDDSGEMILEKLKV